MTSHGKLPWMISSLETFVGSTKSLYIYVIIGIEPSVWAVVPDLSRRQLKQSVGPPDLWLGWLVRNLGLGQLSPHIEALFLKFDIVYYIGTQKLRFVVPMPEQIATTTIRFSNVSGRPC